MLQQNTGKVFLRNGWQALGVLGKLKNKGERTCEVCEDAWSARSGREMFRGGVKCWEGREVLGGGGES